MKVFRIPSLLFIILACFSCDIIKETDAAVFSVSLSQPTAEMIIGETVQLYATVLPSNANYKSVLWASSKQSVATVSDSGVITAVAEGVSTITASAGGKSATCLVTVSKVAVVSVSLDWTSYTLEEERSTTLVATVRPANATDSVIWSSSDTSVAIVDQNGTVTAVKNGYAIITAKAGDKQATCSITVKKRVVAVASVTLSKTELSLNKGQTETLTAIVKPDNATNLNVTWASANTDVATVSYGTVIAVGGGVTEVNVKTLDGGFEAKCKVTVKVPVQSVSLNTTSLGIYQYDVETLKASIYPSDATNKAVSWSSDRPGVASVDSNGKVTGVSSGSATITAKSYDGGHTAMCTVTVTADGHQAIDLGLSVKWATTNFGTTSTTATGGYYMWGDPTGTATALDYSAPNLNSISGTGYDIVRKNWGGNWRIPSRTELSELYTKCTWKQETVSGVSVFRVTGPNGNSIIFPFTGLGYPASGPAGTKQYISMDRAYIMSGDSYSDEYGRFAYVYYYSKDGKYNWESYNANLVYITIRPVR